MQTIRDGLNQTLPDDLPPVLVIPGYAAFSYPATHGQNHNHSAGTPCFRNGRALRNSIERQSKDRSTIPT
jgi:hypothetical protein